MGGISYCPNCYCMTKSVERNGKIVCGKCGCVKKVEEVYDYLKSLTRK